MKLFFILLIVSVNALAFKLEPMVVDFAPHGPNSTKNFRIDNESKEKVAVKIEAFIRKLDANGKEERVPTDHFKIFPEQLSLLPSDSRAIRVTYQGAKELTSESAYRIVATQLPVTFKNKVKKTGVKFLFKFIASVYVTSNEFIPKLEVESLKRINAERVKIKLKNSGQRHRQLKGVKVILKDKSGRSLALNESVIKDWDAGNILAGGQRAYSFKSDLKFDLKKNGAVIEIKDEK
jgi:fimbrial chaperone protein